MRRTLLTSILLSLVVAGCTGAQEEKPGETDWSFGDARERVMQGSSMGDHTNTKRFNVPAGATDLVIKAKYEVQGDAELQLTDPTGKAYDPVVIEGIANQQDERWFEEANPTSGQWRLDIQIEGLYSYAFGMYWTLPPAGGGGGGGGGSAPQQDATAPDSSDSNLPTILVASGGATLGAGGLALLATEFGRFKFLKFLAAFGLFTRLEKDEVLAHEKREQVYTFIKNNPGPSFSDLRRELELSNGTLIHHLRILESQEYIKTFRDGFRTRFYVRGPKITPTTYLTRTQAQLLDVIGANPGVTQKELTSLLGLPRESVSYHTKRLAANGKLMVRQEGKWRRYFTTAASSPAGSAVPGPMGSGPA